MKISRFFLLVPAFIITIALNNFIYSQASVYEWGIKFISHSTANIVGEDGAIIQTTDGGLDWVAENSNTTNVLYATDFVDNSNGVTVGENGIILVTHDGGNTWNYIADSSIQTDLYSVKSLTTGTYIACGEAGVILMSVDNGQTWNQIQSNTGSDLYKVVFIDKFIGYIVGDQFTFMKTVDGGNTWFLYPTGFNGFTLNSISMVNENTGTVVGDNGVILNTTDGGNSWFGQTGVIPTVDINDIVYLSNTDAILVGDNGLIMATTNAGSEFFAVSSNTDYCLTSVNFSDMSHGISVGEAGTQMYTNDGGNTWSASPSLLIAKYKNTQSPGSSGQENKPANYKISQNYPNPFNPTTQIKFALPFDSKVSIKVYDLTGKEVRTLVNDYKQAGNYAVGFNGSNLASGVYFYKIYAVSGSREYSETMRMILAK